MLLSGEQEEGHHKVLENANKHSVVKAGPAIICLFNFVKICQTPSTSARTIIVMVDLTPTPALLLAPIQRVPRKRSECCPVAGSVSHFWQLLWHMASKEMLFALWTWDSRENTCLYITCVQGVRQLRATIHYLELVLPNYVLLLASCDRRSTLCWVVPFGI